MGKNNGNECALEKKRKTEAEVDEHQVQLVRKGTIARIEGQD